MSGSVSAGAWAFRAAILLFAFQAFSASITLQTNVLGPTPSILAFNSGHFYPGSNTREWWRYSGVNGARVFVSPSNVEPTDDLAPVGDGVTSAGSFLARRAAIRTNPFNPAYINWSIFTNNYQNNDLAGNNHILVNYAFSELRSLGVQICAQITASQSRLPIASTTDWPNMWELWQHYYAQAFHLGRVFDVERYQMFNEPNHSNAGGLTVTNYLLRLQLASDAVQCALEDVNRLYAKDLTPKILAPVTAGSAESSFDWGRTVVANRHTNFLGQYDPGFSLIHVYDFHQYNSTPAVFGSSLASLHSLLATAMAPEPRYPTAISEFNTHTGATFDTMVETLDSPTEYPRFGAICANLMANGCDELYCFKFSQTASSNPNYPVQKNAMHYVDSSAAPYNVGGITKAGEVWRLFAKAFIAGRQRLGITRDIVSSALDLHASYDPQSQLCYLFSANNTSSAFNLELDVSAGTVPEGNRVLVEEVSESSHGAARSWTTLSAGGTLSLNQAARSVLLFTFPTRPQQQQFLTATDDAEVRDGSNRDLNFGSAAAITVRNDPMDAANRSAGLIKFQLPTNDLSNLQFAILSLEAASATINTTAQAHVYGVTGNWSQESVCWTNAPNLKQGAPAGATIRHSVISGLGDSAMLVGQLVTTFTNSTRKLLDVSAFVRAQTPGSVSFLISQDPRWNLALPSLEPGDVQPDGMRIASIESGAGAPQLILVFPPDPTNAPPIARDDFATTPQGVPVEIDVLENDVDPDGTALHVESFTPPLHGSVSNLNQALTYFPNPGFYGIDSFSYTVADEQGGVGTAFVQVTVTAPPDSSAWFWTNLPVLAEACIRGGASADVDQDEAALGYLMVKYNPAPFDFARKAYFQFDLSGLLIDPETAATFTVTTHFINNFAQRAQLWALDQPYSGFTPSVTWQTAQANDTASNDLLTSGAFTATPFGPALLVPSTTGTPHDFALPMPGDFLRENRITLALAGVDDAANNAGGLRWEPGTATLRVRAALPPPVISAIHLAGGQLWLSFQGMPGRSYTVFTATNLFNPLWIPVATNIADPAGLWSWTEAHDPLVATRFYRAGANP